MDNIQPNGLIPVLVLREISNNEELWQRIKRRGKAALSHVVIKWSVDFVAVGRRFGSMIELKIETQLAKVVHAIEPDYTQGPLEFVVNRRPRQGVKGGDRFLVCATSPTGTRGSPAAWVRW